MEEYEELANHLLRLAHNWQARHRWQPAPAAPAGPALLRQLLGLREWLGLFEEGLREEVDSLPLATHHLLIEQYALLHRTARRWQQHLQLQLLRQRRHEAIRAGEMGRAWELRREEIIYSARLSRSSIEGENY